MEKEKRILFYFIGWLLLGLIICFLGIHKSYAATYYLNYNYYQQYYDNNGSSVSSVSTTWNESLQSYVSSNINTIANSYGAGLAITSPIPILSNHTYTLSIYFEERNNIALSSKNKIAIGNSLSGVSTNYADSNYWAETLQTKVSNNSVIQFVFKANGPASYIFIPWTTTSNANQTYVLTEINMEDLGSEGISQEDINNSLNLQTNTINSSIQNSTDTITGEINDMESSLNEQLGNKCNNLFENELQSSITHRGVTFTPIFKNGLLDYYNVSGVTTSYNSYAVIGYYDIPAGVTITVPKINGLYLQLYDQSSGQIIEQFNGSKTINSSYSNIEFNIFADTDFNGTTSKFWVQVNEGSGTTYCPYGSYSSKLDDTNDKLDETNQNLNDIEGALTDSSPTDVSGLGDSAGWLPAGPVDSILNLPLTMLNNLVTNLGNSCQTISVELPFVKKDITLPCIKSLYDKMGVTGTLFTTAGLIASAFILFNYLLALYKWVDDTLTMRENTMPGYFDDNWGGGA